MSLRFWSDQHLTFSVTAPDGSCEEYKLQQPFAILGSKANCDVVIDDAKVQPHCLFVWQTSVGLHAIVLAANARKLGRVFRVKPGHPIQVRDWTVSVSATPIESSSTTSEASPEVEESAKSSNTVEMDSHAVYCLTWKSEIGRQYLQLPNGRMFLVGRKKPASLVLDDSRLSSAHCGVIRVGKQLWAIDLGSANGTWSRSERHRVHEINIDKSICIGRQRLHFTRLITEQGLDATTGELNSLQEAANELRGELSAAQNDATYQQATLLTSLRLAEQHSDEIKLQHEEKIERQERLLTVYQHELAQQQNEVAEIQRARAELLGELESTRDTVQKNEELLRQVNEANEALLQHRQTLEAQHEALLQEKTETDSELANREMELSLREKELDRLAEEVTEQRSETEQLQSKLVMERRILETLELELGQHDAVESSTAASVDDEHLVASPEFHSILDKALGALPRLDES